MRVSYGAWWFWSKCIIFWWTFMENTWQLTEYNKKRKTIFITKKPAAFIFWGIVNSVKCVYNLFFRHTLGELSTSTRSCGSSSSSTGSSLTPGTASSGGRSVRSPPRSDNSTITTSELLFLHLFAQMEVNQLGDCTIKRIPFYGKGEQFRRDFQINFLHNYFSLNQGKIIIWIRQFSPYFVSVKYYSTESTTDPWLYSLEWTRPQWVDFADIVQLDLAP